MTDMMDAFVDWVRAGEAARGANFRGYVHGIAQARYVVRKVFRIVDEEARKWGVDSLEHQMLLQLFGGGVSGLTVSALAERLDIAAAFGSRLIKALEVKGYVQRRRSEEDRRVTRVIVTEKGEELLRTVDKSVHMHVEYFQTQLTADQRLAALAIYAFYLGLGADSHVGAAISSALTQRGSFLGN